MSTELIGVILIELCPSIQTERVGVVFFILFFNLPRNEGRLGKWMFPRKQVADREIHTGDV